MGERYYLRLLLTVVCGAQSFDHLRTVDGLIHTTFKAACIALKLLEDDGEWVALFNDGKEFMTGRALRHLFALALQHTTITNPLYIWPEFGESFCDDLQRLLVTGRVIPPAGEARREVVLHLDYGLYHIQQLLNEYGRSVEEFGLPQPVLDWLDDRVRARGNGVIGEELGYDVERERALAERMREQLNEEQMTCFNDIVAAVEHYHEQVPQRQSFGAFFLHGPAGTGKTFLYNCLWSHFRSQGKIVLCVASSGIAAQLLPGGRTAHSRFKIPLSNDINAVCNITRNSALAELIRNTSFIIWDEVPMQHKACFEAVSRTLNDLCDISGREQVFGGIPTVLSGDFAQILPVIRRGTRQATVNACIRHGSIWEHLRVLKLTTSMRVVASDANRTFLTFLRNMATNPHHYGWLQLPAYIRQVSTVDQLCNQLYPQALLNEATTTHGALLGRAILAFRNDTVNDFNNVLLDRMPGQEHRYEAINHVAVAEEAAAAEPFAAEYLQRLDLGSLPPSCLRLKIGVPVILIRNLSPREGLCNGTRMRVVGISRNCLQVAILGGRFDGEIRLLPRIKLTTTEEDLPFILERTQFPVRPCFAMTVNKSQGQSLQQVGVDLRTKAFTHGQLYVALSRVTSLDGLTLLPSEDTPNHTENIIYPEVLL